jgi:hypothetical protein
VKARFQSVICLLSLCAASQACADKGAKHPEGACKDGRQPLECTLDFSPEAQKIKANVNWLGIGGGDVETERVALQQIQSQTQNYLFESKKLCEEYNACIVDPQTYSTRSENLRRRMAGIPDLYEEVKSASTPEQRRSALAKSYSSVVPDEQRIELFLDFGILALRPGETAERPIEQGETLPTDTRLKFVLRASAKANVYVFQQAPSGAVNVLFPDSRMALDNPVPDHQAVEIPPGGARFRVNEQDIGTEKVFIAASLSPIPSLADAVAKFSQGSTDATPIQPLARVESGPSNCNTRALELDRTDNHSGCVRSRGLELASDSPAQFSARTRSEAADGTIVKLFTFQHTSP